MSNEIKDGGPAKTYTIDKVAFDSSSQPDRGFSCKATYLKEPDCGDALIEVFRDKKPLRAFLFPAYKIWNIAAHFQDIVDGELGNNVRGYEMAAWNGISGATFILPQQGDRLAKREKAKP